MIRRGVLLKVTTITEEETVAKKGNLWRVIEIVGDAVCLQSQDEVADKYGNIYNLFWMRKSELEECPNLEVVPE
jgi:hypothetical protein